MIRRLPLLVLLAALPAHAEDFSGFYAGVNAGYGRSRETESGIAQTVSPGPPASGDRAAPPLPPSASAAAAGIQRTSRAGTGR